MNFPSDHCFTAKDIYDSAQKSKWGINMKHVRTYKQDMIRELCAQIFTYFFYLVILDIIENNVTFVLPMDKRGNRNSNISVKCFEGEAFQRLYRAGSFQGIDFLSSNFKGYRLNYQYDYNGGMREKDIYIDHKLKKIFYDNINNGKVYY